MKKLLAKGFTLIELLVVISIIAILAAMLLPSLGKAKEQANAVKSMSNLKSLGSAMAMYAMEANDKFPRGTTLDRSNGTANAQTGVKEAWYAVYANQELSINLFKAPGGPTDVNANEAAEVITSSSYAMNAATLGRGSSKSTTIHAGDHPEIWGKEDYFNSLFTDASVKKIVEFVEMDPDIPAGDQVTVISEAGSYTVYDKYLTSSQ